MPCCRKRPFCTSLFSEDDVLEIRGAYLMHKTAQEKMQALIDQCAAMIDWNTSDKRMHCKVNSLPVCVNAYAILHGCSPGKLRLAHKFAARKQSAPEHGNIGKKEAPAEENVIAWLRALSEHDCDKRSARDVVAPPCMPDWKTVFTFFEADHPDLHVAYNTFVALRRRHFPHLHLRKPDDFAHCDDCEALHLVESKAPTPGAKAQIHAELLQHLAGARYERDLEKYAELQAQHGECLHMGVDGSKPIRLPYEEHKPEACPLRILQLCSHMFCLVRVSCAIPACRSISQDR